MLLKWLPSNQLQIEASELFTQYTQLVNKLYVQTNVYDLQTVMTATFSRFDASTQTWENIAESGTILVGNTAQNGMTGYLFENYIPASVFEEEGQVGLTLTAQTPTGILNGDGEMTYTVNTSGIFKIYINKSLDNGALPVPDDLSDIIIRLQTIEDDMVKVGQTTVETETLAPGTPATFTLTRQPNGYTLVKVGIPQGLTGAAAGFAEPKAMAYTVDPDEAAKVTVTASGPDTAKQFDFVFDIPQGQKGEMGGANGLLVEKEGDENILYLALDGEAIGTGVPIPQGGGSGGGGGGSTGNNAVLTATNTSGFISKTVAEGATVDLSFTWSSIENELPTGNGSLRVIVNGSTRASYEIEQGAKTVDVSAYLTAGSNKVRLEISDIYGNTRTINFTITTVALGLTSYFDGTQAYTGAIVYSYIPTGAVEKTMHFVMDGTEIGTTNITVSGREQTFTIPAQTHGSHIFDVYFTCTIDGQTVTSDHLKYDLICYVEGNNTTIISAPFFDASVLQFSTVAIPYVVYTPNALTTSTQLKEDNTVLATLTVDRTQQIWSYKALDAGATNLSIVANGTTKEIEFTVAQQEINVSATTENLELYLSSAGRSNNEANPLTWGYNGINAQFSNFNLTSDGWQLDEKNNTVLRVQGNARVTIPFNIFAQDLRATGKTIEFEFKTSNVLDYETTVISAMSGGKGINITAQQANLTSAQANVGSQYKDGDNVRVSFVVQKQAENRLLQIFVNGIMSGCVQYPTNDNFQQSTPVGITIGSNDCTTDIYCMRVYGINLNAQQIVENWIADTQDAQTLFERYNRNNIFDEYGAIVPGKLPNNLPYLVINVDNYNALPQSKGDKKIVSGYYIDPLYASRSFTFEGAEIDVQGTSSQYYARKNYKINFKNGFVINGQAQPNYAMRPTSMPTNIFTFKADVASSEGANNVELVGLYEDTCPVKTPPQQTNSKVRQGIEGHPCVLFYGNSNLTFLGKYNFNNDKETADVFGFEPGDESWEILQNNTALALFKTNNFANWQNTFEGRYPEKSTNIAKLQEFVSWVASTDTTVAGLTDEQKQERLAKFKNELADHANVDALLYNYIFTEMFLMIDNRAKNAFPTRYDEDGKWLILPYDYDTAIGTDNSGNLRYGYWLEDTDTINNANVFNGQDSVLYVNLRLCFADEIAQMYKTLRNGDVFAYEEIEKRFDEHQKAWGENIFNEDAKFKYIDPLTEKGEATYLPMLQGSKTQQRKWWLYNRFRYLDSKYTAGDAVEDVITLRPTDFADLQITPFADVYVSASFDGVVVQERATRGETYTLEYPNEEGNDPVIAIYSASQLTSVGDLSPLKVKRAEIGNAIRLGSLKLGDSTNGYTNPGLEFLSFGNLTLLRTLDLSNCTNFAQSVDLSNCPNITTVLCDGTKVAGFISPNGGQLATLYLPADLNSLQVRNQTAMTDFVLPSWANVSTLWVENTPNIDTLTAINNIQADSRVRLIGFNWTFSNAKAMFDALEKTATFSGLDENGNNVTNAVLSGTVNVPLILTGQLAEMNALYPNITVNYDEIMESPPEYTRGLLTKTANFGYIVTGNKINTRVFADSINIPYVNGVNVTTIGDYAMQNCTGLTSVSFPLCQEVKGYAFYATNIEEAVFPELLTIGSNAFQTNRKMLVCRIPKVESIGYQGFSGCRLLLDVYLPATPPTLQSYAFKDINSACTFHIPAGSLTAYQNATNWSALTGQYTFTEDA